MYLSFFGRSIIFTIFVWCVYFTSGASFDWTLSFLFIKKVLDEFLKTECYHHFHCYCLYTYIMYYKRTNEEKVDESLPTTYPCPVCREQLTIVLDTIRDAKPPLEEDEVCEKAVCRIVLISSYSFMQVERIECVCRRGMSYVWEYFEISFDFGRFRL